MSRGRIKLDLDFMLKGYGFLTMLLSGDALNFGYTGHNHLPFTSLGFSDMFYGEVCEVTSL